MAPMIAMAVLMFVLGVAVGAVAFAFAWRRDEHPPLSLWSAGRPPTRFELTGDGGRHKPGATSHIRDANYSRSRMHEGDDWPG